MPKKTDLPKSVTQILTILATQEKSKEELMLIIKDNPVFIRLQSNGIKLEDFIFFLEEYKTNPLLPKTLEFLQRDRHPDALIVANKCLASISTKDKAFQSKAQQLLTDRNYYFTFNILSICTSLPDLTALEIKINDATTKFIIKFLVYPSHSPSTRVAETLEQLLAAGADFNVVDSDHSNFSLLEDRYQYEYQFSRMFRTVLMWAARNGDPSTVETLIAAGSDVNARDACGNTAVMLAACSGDIKRLDALIAAGGDVRAKDNFNSTALMHAASSNNVMRLYKEGTRINTGTLARLIPLSDIDAQNTFGRTALHDAAHNGDEAAVVLLLRSGADASIRDEKGKTPYETISNYCTYSMKAIFMKSSLSRTVSDAASTFSSWVTRSRADARGGAGASVRGL